MKNTAELLGHYGSDLTHAASAWTSTLTELTPERIERVPDLLLTLAKNGHHTPFEKSLLHFNLRVDTATHIHLLKHRIGVSVNGESARYKALKNPSGVAPADWPEEWKVQLSHHVLRSIDLYLQAIADLTPTLGRKRAKESARFFLPYANQLSLDVSFNFRSFQHFLGLRNKPDAQKEIRDLSAQMLELVAGIEGNPFRYSLAAFVPRLTE